MKKIFLWALLPFMLGLSLTSTAQKADISLKLKKGDVYIFNTDMVNTINQVMMGQIFNIKQNINMVMKIEVAEVLSQTSYKIKQTYDNISLDMDMNGQQQSFSSEDSNDPAAAVLSKIKSTPFSYEVNSKGEISNLSGYEELLNNIAGDQQGAQLLKGIINKDNLNSFFQYIPKETVKQGESYDATIEMAELFNMKATTKYTVAGIDSKNITLGVSSEFNMNPEEPIEQQGMSMKIKVDGTQKGNMVISKSSGMPVSSELTGATKLLMTTKNPQTDEDMTIDMNMNSVVKISVKE